MTKAMEDPTWCLAMQEEFNALISNNTWELVHRSPEQNVLRCKQVFWNKENPDGSLAKRKARLVVNGMRQRDGLDYNQTFAPVVKPVTNRIVLALSVQNNWEVNQLDISNAFLHRFLDEGVYMRKPNGFIDKE